MLIRPYRYDAVGPRSIGVHYPTLASDRVPRPIRQPYLLVVIGLSANVSWLS